MKQLLRLKKKLLLLFFTVVICFSAKSQTIKGKIFDAKTGEPLTGATISIQFNGGVTTYASARLDGSYNFNFLRSGGYALQVKFLGYQDSKIYQLFIKTPKEVVIQNVFLADLNTQLTEVNVTAQGSKMSDASARNLERSADVVLNVLSQNAIQLLPDVTVGSALQRISGVTVQRTNTGEGRYAIIRGMDQRYNNTLVNGIKIPSPDDKYRFVPMDIFPSELLERLEVIKTLTPALEGDAIGGTMNLIMKSAPQQFLLNANAAIGYSFLFSDRPFSAFGHSGIQMQSPAERYGNDYAATYKDFTTSNLNYHNLSTPVNSQYGLTIGDRFLNNKLGVILSAGYQNFFRGSNSDYLVPNAQPALGNTPFFSDGYSRQYSTQTSQVGLNNKIDYIINNRNKLSLYNFYLHQNEYQSRFTADTVLGINSTSTQKEVDIENRSMLTKQSIYNGTLKGEHQLTNALHLNWTGVYSIAKKEVPDMASYVVEHDINLNNSGQVTGVDSVLKSMDRRWMHNSDKDLAGYLDLIYNKNLLNRNVEFAFGGLYRHKTRTNYDNDYTNLVAFPIGVKQPFTTIDNAVFGFGNVDNSIGNFTTLTANDYTAYENVLSEYLQLKFRLLDRLEIIGGVRIESTQDNYNTGLPVSYNQRSGNISYTDVLPSVNLKYALTDDQNLRLAYYKAISRPGFGDIVPILIPGEYFDQEGNPYVKHTRADNYDFRYELFPGGADQLLLGTFYKEIYDPIEYFVVRNGGPSAQFIQPQNVNQATNFGAEAQLTKFFGFIGVSANYTYTHSRVTTSKLFYNSDGTQSVVNQTRPLQGQADNVGNLSVLYKSNSIGLNAQLAFVYTGERIAQVSPYYDLDYWNRGYGQLDFSFEKSIIKHLTFYGKVNNLTNAANKVFLKYPHGKIPQSLSIQDAANETLVERDLYKISFLGGLRYKF